jgi:two-component system OmpR family sensor kinase
MYSLRRTLAVRFCLTMFVALVLIALWAFLGAHRTLRQQLDAALASGLTLELDMVAAGEPLAPHGGPPDFESFVREVNQFVVLRDSSGRLIAANTSLAHDLPLDRAAFAAAAGGGRRWTTERWGEHWVRSVYAPVPGSGTERGPVLEVSGSLAPLEWATRDMLLLMAGTVLLGTMATAVGAGWLSRSALVPVAEIAQQAQGIQPGLQGQRITVHADVTELQGLVRVLNETLERLERAFQAQRRITADVGHELRTPLTVMRGAIEIALRGERPAGAYRAALRSVLEEADHLSTISEAMILLARVEGGELKPRRMPVDLAALAAAAVERAAPRAGGRTLTFTNRSGSNATAPIDAAMLRVVLDQLLDNALRHTPVDAGIVAEVAADGPDILVAVRDTGPGVSDELLPQLFERLYRGDPARSRTAGAGLGLTLARAIVEAHQGSITAANLPASGFRVTVKLPRLAEAASAS